MTRRRQVRIRKRINRLRRSAPWLRTKPREVLFRTFARLAGQESLSFGERIRRGLGERT